MDSISLSQFREFLHSCVEQIVNQHAPVKITDPQGVDFVVISAEDWQREQETLHVLQSSSLVQQIADSLVTHAKRQGYSLSEEEIDEILSV